MYIYLIIFLLLVFGYSTFFMEKKVKINKAFTAIAISIILWGIFVVFNEFFLKLELGETYFLAIFNKVDYVESIREQFFTYLSSSLQIVFFLFLTLIIVQIVENFQGFSFVNKKIAIKPKLLVVFLWGFSFFAFFISVFVNTLYVVIFFIFIFRMLIRNKEIRWFFIGIIIIAASAGGACSPIGSDVNIALWLRGYILTMEIIYNLFPSFITLLVSLILASFYMKKNFFFLEKEKNITENIQGQIIILILGIFSIIFVVLANVIVHFHRPYISMLFPFVLIVVVAIFIAKRNNNIKELSFSQIYKNINFSVILFLFGLIMIAGVLETSGLLSSFNVFISDVSKDNIFVISIVSGLLSSFTDNLALVVSFFYKLQMSHEISNFYSENFWRMLSYSINLGGNIFIFGSISGIFAMGIERIKVSWYLKNISLIAFIGFLFGILMFLFY